MSQTDHADLGREVEAQKKQRPMVPEYTMFFVLMVFFFVVAIVYLSVTHSEPIGTAALLGLGGMFGFAGIYLWLTARRIDFRPSDDLDGEIAEGAGDVGEFNPQSWWPLACGVAAAILALGLAVGWWMFGIGLVLGAITVIGYAFENHRGIRAH